MIYEPVVIIKEDMVTIHREARVDSFVKIEGGEGVSIERCVHIASFCHILGGGLALLEEGSAMASGSKLITGTNKPTGRSMSAAAPKQEQVVERSFVILRKNSCLGTNSVVMPGVEIGEGAVLGALGLATKDIPPFEIWGGVPARKIKDRIIDEDISKYLGE